jgi:hypothetical protein
MKNKIAFIRSNDTKICPFGLDITRGCRCAGKSVLQMAPLNAVKDEGRKKTLAKANNLVFLYNKDGNECSFSDKILEDFDKVNCNFGDTAEGQKTIPIAGSGLYPTTFSGIGADTLQAFPLGYYTDHLPSRNLFYGLFSFLGSQEVDQIIKIADKYDECGEKEKANKIDELVEKMEEIRSKEDFQEMFQEIKSILDEYKEKYQDERKDSGLLNELAEKWWGLRQVHKS